MHVLSAAEFELYGNAAAYFDCEDREVLNEGGARCGKTHSELVKALHVAETYPGSRQLFARETRKSLTETVLPDWENKILGPGHPALGKRQRNARDTYQFSNGATVVLHGLDDPINLLSGEFDRIYVFQAEQIAQQETWDALLSRLSGNATPYTQATADANPGAPNHWLIKRVEEVICLACAQVLEPDTPDVCQRCGSTLIGRMAHHAFRHNDNPLFFDWEAYARGVPPAECWRPRGIEYVGGILGRLRGIQRSRLRDHLWVSAEGMILEDWDPAVHRIAGKLERNAAGWQLLVTSPGWSIGSKDPMREARVRLDWFGCGADWGFSPRPAVLQVWGYDRYGRRFLVAQVHRVKKQMDWWAGVAEKLYQEFKFRYIAVDPSMPALIDAFNNRLGPIAGRSGPMIAMGADNTIKGRGSDLAGIDLLRWGLRAPDGTVRTFYWKDSQREGVDPELREAGRPTCVEAEIPGYVYARVKSTGEMIEEPDPTCYKDGIDASRYEAAEGWGRRHEATLGPVVYPANSKGAVHNHAEKMAKARAWREQHGG